VHMYMYVTLGHRIHLE